MQVRSRPSHHHQPPPARLINRMGSSTNKLIPINRQLQALAPRMPRSAHKSTAVYSRYPGDLPAFVQKVRVRKATTKVNNWRRERERGTPALCSEVLVSVVVLSFCLDLLSLGSHALSRPMPILIFGRIRSHPGWRMRPRGRPTTHNDVCASREACVRGRRRSPWYPPKKKKTLLLLLDYRGTWQQGEVIAGRIRSSSWPTGEMNGK